MEEKDRISKSTDEESSEEASASQEYVAPGVPIVRTSTPRPAPLIEPMKTSLPLAPSTSPVDFPIEAPDAPPLPEEAIVDASILPEQKQASSDTSGGISISRSSTGEFIWLFEYALDMDPVRLNRPERLDGSAFVYGPAMLKGYRLAFKGLDALTGRVVASLDEVRDQPEAEVWGVLYRVPRRFTRDKAGETPLLDKVHFSETFIPVEIQVREPYRQREITCITYIASEETRHKIDQLPAEKRVPDPAYFKRLLQVARRQKLPMSYLHTLEELTPQTLAVAASLPSTPIDQDTEPLPALVVGKDFPENTSKHTKVKRLEEGMELVEHAEHRPGAWEASYPVRPGRWLMAFALYISLILLGTLVLAIFQGLNYWPGVFNNAFTPLGIPWYVLLYGLLGACISCAVSLNQTDPGYTPAFVILTWFTRPFLGALLGAFAYLVLTSGVILVNPQSTQRFALCSVVAALAGLCEGKLILRRK
jgi:hypothetical protein